VGYLILLGIAPKDTDADAVHLAEKIVHLRIFSDERGKMNRSLAEVDGRVLVVSQFTLFADLKKEDPASPRRQSQTMQVFCMRNS